MFVIDLYSIYTEEEFAIIVDNYSFYLIVVDQNIGIIFLIKSQSNPVTSELTLCFLKEFFIDNTEIIFLTNRPDTEIPNFSILSEPTINYNHREFYKRKDKKYHKPEKVFLKRKQRPRIIN